MTQTALDLLDFLSCFFLVLHFTTTYLFALKSDAVFLLTEFRPVSSLVAFKSCALVTVAFNKIAPELAVSGIVYLSMYFRHGLSQIKGDGCMP